MEKTTHIAVIPSPGFSHLIPLLEFSKRLVHLHPDFHVTFIITSLESTPSSSIAYFQNLPTNIQSIFLPPIPKQDLPIKEANTALQIQLTVIHSMPSLKKELESLNSKSHLAALVADPFAAEVLNFTKELNTLSFIYFPSNASTLSFCLYLPTLQEKISGEFRDLQEPIMIPGCVPFHGRDLPDPVQNRSSESYKMFLKRSKALLSVDGILVNSFMEMEEKTIKAMMTQEESGYPPVYPVGPITQTGSNSDENGSECLKWLENQPPSSVIYVSFGSGATISQDQINELAFGLEMSGQKFLWVLRTPSNSINAAYLGSSNDQNPLDFLPKGFLERTKEQGFVIPFWAPQISILSHSSIGGFLSHCGWNSTLESVQKGVPLIALPLFAEQRMNAVLLTEGLKVALRPKVNENGIMEREEIAKSVKSLIEGEEGKEICKRMKDLKDASYNALKEDGSSTKTLSQVALKWKNNLKI